MDNIKLEKPVGVDGFLMLNGVKFIDHPLIITMPRDLRAHVRHAGPG